MLTKTEARPRRGSGDGQVLGAMLVVLGAGWLLHQAGVLDLGWRAMLSALLVTLGVGLVFTARRSGAGLVIAGVVMTVVLAASSSAPSFDWDWNHDFRNNNNFAGPNNFRDRVITVVPEQGLVVNQAGGDIDVDLRNLASYTGTRTVDVRLGVGELVVRLPSTVRVKVDAHVGVGEVRVLDETPRDGITVDESYADPDFEAGEQQLVIDARIRSAGDITITREPAG